MKADGSDKRRLTDGRGPAFSRMARRIVFERGPGIHVIRANGGGERRLTSGNGVIGDASPSYSPDGGTIVFVRGGA